MKRIFSIALAALLSAALLSACGPKASEQTDDNKISVVATIFPPYDFTRAVAGEKANVSMLLPPAAESHSFEPTPQDIIEIQNCDVFIYVGGESDEWVNGVLEPMDTSKMKIITLMDCVETAEEEIVEGMQDEEHEEEAEYAEHGEEAEYDEHVWTSPR
ncbi:MAG: metal ABC transporter substrate-binding protein, partial [Clostridiales bacterium]|nr:metal ABC transporter substrate-binding protein [Clostridiales bacterium]